MTRPGPRVYCAVSTCTSSCRGDPNRQIFICGRHKKALPGPVWERFRAAKRAEAEGE